MKFNSFYMTLFLSFWDVREIIAKYLPI